MRRKDFLPIVSGSLPEAISIVKNLRMNLASLFLPFPPSLSLIKHSLGLLVPCPLCHASLAKSRRWGNQESVVSAPALGQGTELERSTQTGCISQPRSRYRHKHPPGLRAPPWQRLTFHSERTGEPQVLSPMVLSPVQVDGAASVWDRASLGVERKENMVNTPDVTEPRLRRDTPHFPS